MLLAIVSIQNYPDYTFKNYLAKSTDEQDRFTNSKITVYAVCKNELQAILDNCNEITLLTREANNLLSDRESWATCFRTKLPTRGSNTRNYVEVLFKILKDTIK